MGTFQRENATNINPIIWHKRAFRINDKSEIPNPNVGFSNYEYCVFMATFILKKKSGNNIKNFREDK
jgi:hypothetical protein